MTNLARIHDTNHDVEREALFIHGLRSEIRKTIVGQDELVQRVLIGLLADGHILLEGVPGLAKTLMQSSLVFNSPPICYRRIYWALKYLTNEQMNLAFIRAPYLPT